MLKTMKRALSITAIAATAAMVTACGGNGIDGEYTNDRVGASMTIDGNTFTMIEPSGHEDTLEAKEVKIVEKDDGTATITIINQDDREEGVFKKHEDGSLTIRSIPGKFVPAG